ncbi:ISA3 [Auxenochlorella protothecoides x Auxenochlorella symbiontica]
MQLGACGTSRAYRTPISSATHRQNIQPRVRFAERTLASRTASRGKGHPRVGAGKATPVTSKPAKKTATPKPLELEPGSASPLGASPAEGGVNFALAAPHATAVTLCLYNADNSPLQELKLHSTGDVWHGLVDGLPLSGILYGFRVSGAEGPDSPYRWDDTRVLLDPYARLVAGRARFGQRDEREGFQERLGSLFRGTFDFEAEPFDWGPGEETGRPDIATKDLVIYELPLRCFTASPTSGLPEGERGGFLGLKDKIPHLKELGINAVELLPLFEYDELEFQRSPNPRDHMVNVWGYSHLSFFAPMSRFAADGGGPLAADRELKEMVKALHAAGIQVIVDVVYNHTAEGGDDDPYLLSWRGINAGVYYQQDPASHAILNFSGCGNTVAANHPLVQDQILTSLRWWVEEYHVDGFRFDLAPCLCRGQDGEPLATPPAIEAMSKDPMLSKVKLIAEPWDLGLYMVGSFPNWDSWKEWNGQYRDDVRRFIKGDAGFKQKFATRLAGSSDLYNYNKRKASDSINFVIAHDGFTLADSVAYNEKHNDANGEFNRDGTNDNFSWNCGVEGETSDPGVLALRARQMRNLHLALMLSQGTPMILAGDEYAQTRHGNNNYYGHDTELTHYDWEKLEEAKQSGWFRFYAGLIHFRTGHPLLGRDKFLGPQDVTWHESSWEDPESRFLAFTLHDRGQGGGDIYAAFNAHGFSVDVDLPLPPPGQRWARVVDTNLPSPRDFTPGGNKGVDPRYNIQCFSSIMLLAVPVE